MDFSSSPSSSSYSQYKELARAASEGGIRPWLTVASPDMSTMDATTHTVTTTTTTSNNNNKLEDEDEAVTTTTTKDNNTETTQAAAEAAATIYIEREHMFDKVVTPSDVGKLNRLVIPKQHAEKYFPLDSAANEKGLLLNFEDRSGKAWRFRYSYWNSSQSYVMTKGWSRFVKEKKLDAGDIISFQRGVGEVGKDRFFIDWRRRQPEMMPPLLPPRLLHLGNDHPGAAILFPAAGYHGISFNPSQYHQQGQYRYNQNHHQQYLSSASPWSSNIGQPLIVRPPPPLPPPPPLVEQQQLPVVVRDHYNPHYHGQMKQVNMINMVHQQQYHPGNQYQHDRNVNVVGRSSSGIGVHNNQYYHHHQQYYNGNHHDQNNEYDHHGREAVLSPPRGASCCSSIVYMNGSVTDPGRVGCGGGGGRSESTAYGMGPVVQPREVAAAAGAPKQLRLFGVNMDCSISQADHDGNVVFGVDVVAASQHHDIRNHHNRDDHDHQLSNSQNAAVSAPFPSRLYGDNPTNSISLGTSSQSHLQEKGKSSLSLDLGI